MNFRILFLSEFISYYIQYFFMCLCLLNVETIQFNIVFHKSETNLVLVEEIGY